MTPPAITPIAPIAADLPRIDAVANARPATRSFTDLLLTGVEKTNQQLVEADDLAAAFVLDDSIPLHQVTYALEHARLSFELLMEVRAQLTSGFQELMRMQL